jgi:hypothetical protein
MNASEVYDVSSCELSLSNSYVRDCHQMNCKYSIVNGNLYSIYDISTSRTNSNSLDGIYLYNFSLTGEHVNIIFGAESSGRTYHYNTNIDISRPSANDYTTITLTLTPTSILTDRFIKYNGTNVISYSSSDLYKDVAQIIV